MKYRSEIDGLRAIAVVPVIAFHAGFSSMSGGFVGVDIFFVISGYLITSIIAGEMAAGTFTVAGFYERRARRILPALVLVIACCLPFAWLWMPPMQLRDFAQSIAGVSLFSSNILFWKESGYFSPSADLKPLLHTWSLAVEEQYYVLFPLVMLALWKLGRRLLLPVFAVTLVASLTLSQGMAVHYPNANFYLIPTRLWELLLGSMLAIHVARASASAAAGFASRALFAQCASLTGLALIGISIVAFDRSTPFPSVYALAPTVGTALVIRFATEGTLAQRILSSTPLVAIGLVSYSAYLWHQPLFAFARLRSLHEPGALLMAGLGAAALLAAYASWRWVEKPFRNRRWLARPVVLGLAVAVTGVLFVVGVFGHLEGGFPERHTAAGIAFRALDLNANTGLSAACDHTFTLTEKCRTSDAPEVLVWGDSYAMHLVDGIVASNPDVRLIQMTKSSCAPFLSLASVTGNVREPMARECVDFNRQVADWVERNDTVRYAVLSSSFSAYLVASPTHQHYVEGEGVMGGSPERAAQHFAMTLALLERHGITPVIVAPPPATGTNLGSCVAKSLMFGASPSRCDFDIDAAEAAKAPRRAFLRKLEATHRVLWLDDGICVGGACRPFADGHVVYNDVGHLSPKGSAQLGARMDFYGQITGAAGD